MMQPDVCKSEVYTALMAAITTIMKDELAIDAKQKANMEKIVKLIAEAAPVIINHVQKNAKSPPGVSGGPLV